VNAARAKVDAEGECRVCGIGGPERLDAAHVWDRSQGGADFDEPDAVVPLCSRIKGGTGCHDDYDDHLLNLWGFLTAAERGTAARYAGSVSRARDRAEGRGLGRSAPRDPDLGPFA
jgi:hypothetical protein